MLIVQQKEVNFGGSLQGRAPKARLEGGGRGKKGGNSYQRVGFIGLVKKTATFIKFHSKKQKTEKSWASQNKNGRGRQYSLATKGKLGGEEAPERERKRGGSQGTPHISK